MTAVDIPGARSAQPPSSRRAELRAAARVDVRNSRRLTNRDVQERGVGDRLAGSIIEGEMDVALPGSTNAVPAA